MDFNDKEEIRFILQHFGRKFDDKSVEEYIQKHKDLPKPRPLTDFISFYNTGGIKHIINKITP
jgi:hypothetical protein